MCTVAARLPARRIVRRIERTLAARKKAALVELVLRGLAFVVLEKEDGSRSGETATGRCRARRQ